MQVNEWTKCYESGWKDIITPESFQHPAKMSYGLLKRILAHAKEQGWLNEGDVIVDPFGGIGSTGILGAYEGYQCVMVELERKFIQLAEGYDCHGLTKTGWLRWFNRFGRNPDICPSCHGHAQAWYEKHSGIIPSKEAHRFIGNFELHKDAWVEFGNPYPVILQGDSRRLCEVVEKVDCIVSSPPFQESSGAMAKPETYKGFQHVGSVKHKVNDTKAGYGSTPGQLGSMKPGKVDMVVASPPFCETLQTKDKDFENKRQQARGRNIKGYGHIGSTESYGQTKGNLGNLKSGDVDLVLSSPPYAETPIEQTHMTSNKRGDESDPGYRPSWKKKLKDGYADTKRPYGKSKENLGNLKSGDVDCVISSPPYENAQNAKQDNPEYRKKFNAVRDAKYGKGHSQNKFDQAETTVGNSKGQLGQEQGDTFWQAAKIIVEQCHQILKPGGHAIWVVKSFVRNKRIVDFPGDWQRLCESVGFKTVCIHHAMLVKETSHKTLFGDTEVKRTERKSFFRRLAESKGSPRIDFEVVLCMEKQPLFPVETKK